MGSALARARRAPALIAASLAALLGACDGGDGPSSNPTVIQTAPTIRMVDDAFQPNVLRAPPDSTIRIELRNDGLHPHNFSNVERRISTDVPPGGTRTVTLLTQPSGLLPFFCRFHRDSASMIGMIDVDPTSVGESPS